MNVKTLIALTCFMVSGAHGAYADPSYGRAMHGDLKYGAGFQNFAYVNPDAPKGGTLRLAAMGTFDSLNPFILKGNPAAGLNMMAQGLVFESLMTQADDEPFSMYGLIADTIDVAADRKSVTFTINPKAMWADGQKITADDVVWTFETIMKVGSPFFKAYFGDVDTVKALDARTVVFTFKTDQNRELPLVLAQMAVLPKHYWTAGGNDLARETLTPPLGSGPYKIGTVKPGTSIEYVRDPKWWGADLPVNKGRYNFDRITYDYYRDENVALEAFFAGNYDVRMENTARLWMSGYNAKPVLDGRITKAEIAHSQPVGMQAFIFNIRKPIFADVAVRQALSYAFDYEWSNKQLAGGTYTRTDTFFENSDLGSSGLPSAAEVALLKPYRADIPASVFDTEFKNPVTDGSGNNRANLKKAAEILDAAGYKLGPDGVRVNAKGVRLSFEYLESNPALERWVNPFLQNLKKIGVVGKLRVIDPVQYQNRMNNFDFDMTTSVMPQSDSPGNEQRDYWASAKADINGSRNLIGIKNPAIDALIEKIVAADSRDDLVTATHALDRVLLNEYYVIPGWHFAKWRAAWWNGFDRPKSENTKSLGVVDDWWKIPAAGVSK